MAAFVSARPLIAASVPSSSASQAGARRSSPHLRLRSSPLRLPLAPTIFAFHTGASSRPPSSSFYQVLQIPQDASQSEIKSSYRRLARIYHPDAQIAAAAAVDNGGTTPEEDMTRLFRQINEAYVALSDRESRARYDRQLAAAPSWAAQMRKQTVAGDGGRRPRVGRNWDYDQCW